MQWKIRIWDYDQWLERTVSGETKEEAADYFCGRYTWLKSRRAEIINRMTLVPNA